MSEVYLRHARYNTEYDMAVRQKAFSVMKKYFIAPIFWDSFNVSFLSLLSNYGIQEMELCSQSQAS